ncbi:MAG: phage head closure protein [Rickettsiales bacterium]
MIKNLAGKLRHYIKIQKPIIDNNEKEIWQDFLELHSSVEAMHSKSANQAFIAMQLMDSSFYQFRIRFIKGLKNNMRIIYNDRYFYIKRIINHNEANIVLTIIAQESL